jgi:hypothetical protein
VKYAKFWVLLVALIVGAVFAIYLGAQAKSETKTVTGCLQKGDEPNEYSITDTSGKIYEMRSSEVKLADHLGHKVTVTGRMKGERDEDEDEEREAKGSKKEAGYIQVANLTMVSTSCE